MFFCRYLLSFQWTIKRNIFVRIVATVRQILVVDDGWAIRNLVHRFLNQKYQVD
jgi:hypothetical protein